MPKRTPLYDEERKLGARFTEFAGWELPLYYSSIIEEHMAVRKSCGLFDISHLGKIAASGEATFSFLQSTATNDIAKISPGSGEYTLFCNESGGIIDDDIIYRLADTSYLIVTNAAPTMTMLNWLNEKKPDKVEVENLTEDFCLLALQGPNSPQVLQSIFKENPADYSHYTVRAITALGNKFTVSKSGYTGEEGFEILCEPAAAKSAWRAMLEYGIKPAGLGARDTLRLEMGYPLYGQDITIETNPVEAGLVRFVAVDKGEFIGRKSIFERIEKGASKKLAGFIIDRGIPRSGKTVLSTSGDEIGIVTSGGYSPVLRRGVGMAYIRSEFAEVGLPIEIEADKKQLKGHIAKRPFIDMRRPKAFSAAS